MPPHSRQTLPLLFPFILPPPSFNHFLKHHPSFTHIHSHQEILLVFISNSVFLWTETNLNSLSFSFKSSILALTALLYTPYSYPSHSHLSYLSFSVLWPVYSHLSILTHLSTPYIYKLWPFLPFFFLQQLINPYLPHIYITFEYFGIFYVYIHFFYIRYGRVLYIGYTVLKSLDQLRFMQAMMKQRLPLEMSKIYQQ